MDPKQLMSILTPILPIILAQKCKTRRRDSAMTGKMYYQELLDTNSTVRFREVARMDKRTFQILLDSLKSKGLRGSSHVCEGQKLLITLQMFQGKSNRELQERWQHSGETISRIVHEVAETMLQIEESYIKLPSEDLRCRRYLKDFVPTKTTIIDQ